MNILKSKYLRIVAYISVITIVILLLATWSIELFFKDKLVKYAITQINQQINAKITVTKADFVFWKTFPYASIQFDKVTIRSSSNENNYFITNNTISDTLLTSNKVYFEFNIVKLLNKCYVLKRISFIEGYLFLVVYPDGKANYNIIKSKLGSSNSTKIDLEDIVLKNFSLHFIHLNGAVDINAYTSKTRLRGQIEDKNADFSVISDLKVNSLVVKGINYLSQKNLTINTQISIFNSSLYTFKPSELTISDLVFRFKGNYSTTPFNSLQFEVDGDQLNLKELLSILPEKYKLNTDRYTTKGKCAVHFSLNGRTDGSFIPELNLHFNISKAQIEENVSKIKLQNLEMEGIYCNGKGKKQQLSYIKLNKFTSKIGFGSFSLNGIIEDLLQPKVKLNVFNKLDLSDLKKFLHLDTLDILEGTVESNIRVSGMVGKIDNLSIIDAKNLHYNGQVEIHNAAIKLKNTDYLVKEINGLIKLDNDIYFNNLSLTFNDNSIHLNGKMINGLPYLFRLSNEAIIEAELNSFKIDLSKFFVRGTQESASSYSRELLFPNNISLNLKLNVNEFKLNKFNAKWIKGELFYQPGMVVIKSASFETCQGRVSGNGAIQQDINKNFLIKGQVSVSKLNIQQMFCTFNNFAQNVVRDEHLRGKLTGNINFSSLWNSKLEFRPEMFAVDADVTIFNGELLNFKPLMGLSKFIAVEELQNIKFSTLHNNIFIKDKQIIIPQMDIQSSAFNISGSGCHNFDNTYNYKVRVLLSDFLYGKAKKAKKENEEFGRVEDDGLGRTSLYLNVEGKGNVYKISYDSRKTLDVVKESLAKQKRELKEIFHDEFGWFKSDSVYNKKIKTTKSMEVEWDDSIMQKPAKTIEKQNKKKVSKDKIQVEWE
jgi:hypothetical protein